ncbi:MAG: type II secretion system F family protein, partial [Deltaproteobacteria bacterium]
MRSEYFKIAALVAFGIAIATLTYILSKNPSAERPEVGLRGLKRKDAMDKSAGFAAAEPLVRFIAGRISVLPLDALRERARVQLLTAGDYPGFTPDEYIALSLLYGVLMLGVGTAAVQLANITGLLGLFLTGLGFLMPYLEVQNEVERRFKQVNRGLPFAIDLASMAMSAGLDFPGALRQVTEKSPDKSDALYEELTRVLTEIDLGRTRRQALESFGERCPTESVKDFVAAIVLSEEKGNPLSEVLNIQAGMLRMRRSVAAEEG